MPSTHCHCRQRTTGFCSTIAQALIKPQMSWCSMPLAFLDVVTSCCYTDMSLTKGLPLTRPDPFDNSRLHGIAVCQTLPDCSAASQSCLFQGSVCNFGPGVRVHLVATLDAIGACHHHQVAFAGLVLQQQLHDHHQSISISAARTPPRDFQNFVRMPWQAVAVAESIMSVRLTCPQAIFRSSAPSYDEDFDSAAAVQKVQEIVHL